MSAYLLNTIALRFRNALCFCLQLSAHITRILLNHFKWDKEKLLEKYFDSSDDNTEFFKCAHVINPFNKLPEAVQQRVCIACSY